ncbi:hypothetical protein J1N35_042454 [Gossypium stocksii]|uniref:Reverse transcriptase zinc-binding domain-containing protein n=1 Tax=Gossypium stocksii TaxID=47602 RepID=A0A9D3UHK6_9ROSI|nr:hypothetical protein J1N35_042454 [Gossypium stocksii]
MEGLALECLVKDMITEEGAWDINTLRNWLTEDMIQKIINIPPPYPLAGLNKVFWTCTSNGNFTVKSAYQMLKGSTWNEQDNKWEDVWKFQGPQRVKFFLWLIHTPAY